ncbi:MAG: hypothetical protein FWF15_05180 [Oscillospiraceae bacterium]|nr:hypothetical protein [Oscillospiraceae bacterium]
MDLIEIFKNPDTTYYPCVMWFWNDRITEHEIEFQIKEFKKSKIYEFFIHPLSGMELEYLSEEFFSLIRFAVSIAKENGMKFWIYDEYNWPSGIAGGLLLKQNPETLGCVLLIKKFTLFAGQKLDHKFEGEFVCASILHKNKNAVRENITDRVKVESENGQTRIYCEINSFTTVEVTLAYKAPSAGICMAGLWASFSDFTPGWLDANDRETVNAFINSTHERYKTVIGDEFGKTVLGVFNDEANNFSFFDAAHYNVTGVQAYPWTKHFAEAFQRDHGYDFTPYAYTADCSFLDADSIKKRFDYWETLSHLFADNYVKNVADWCEPNHLKLTGHLSGEESVMWHAYQMGDSYLALKEFHIPGIDNLFSKNYIDNVDFAITAKFAVTAAKFARRKRVICETFSGSGWDLTLQEMKRCLQRIIVAGINMTQYMGAYYSLDCGRKHLPMSYPPSHGYNNPLFAHYGELNTYAARLNALCAETIGASDIFVMLPLISVQIDKNLQGTIDQSWRGICLELIKTHHEYDIASERALYDAKVENGKLIINGFEYGTLVVPDIYYTSQKVIDVINKLTAQNGNVIFCGNTLLTICETGEKVSYAKGELNLKPNFGTHENVYVSHRKTADNDDLYMIVNDNAEDVDIKLDSAGCLFDPFDGTVRAFDSSVKICAYGCVAVLIKKESRVELKHGWRFNAEGGNWLVLPVKTQGENSEISGGYGLKPSDKYTATAEFNIQDIPEFAELIVEYEEGMTVILNNVDISVGLKSLKLWGIRTKSVDVTSILKNGENSLSYVSSIPAWNGPHELPSAYLRGNFKLNDNLELIRNTKQIAPNIWTTQGYPHFSGVGIYETEFTLPDPVGDKLLIEIPANDVVKIILNDEHVKTLLWKPYTTDITQYVKKGENRLRLEFTGTYQSLMQPEEYDLQGQGHLIRRGKSAPAHSGLDNFPVIYILD